MRASQHRVLVADDHEVFRAGLKLVLKSRRIVDVDEAADFGEMMQKLSEGQFTTAMLDLDMPGMKGEVSVATLRATFPDLLIIVISALEDETEIGKVRAAGINAFIPKAWSLQRMMDEVQQVLAADEAWPLETAEPPLSLTSRQREVLARVERGMSNKEIALDLGIAPNTVKIHMSAMFAIFGARSRTQLLLKAKVFL
ncbi:MAG: response regulator transcription factor [Hyphomicrobiaceae bacterium]|nr:response regulator transcription factor [Hyphomicrobiaceae bacterium]